MFQPNITGSIDELFDAILSYISNTPLTDGTIVGQNGEVLA